MAQHAELKLSELLISRFFFHATRKWPLKYLFSLVEHRREGEQTDGNSVIRDYCHFPSCLSSYHQLAKVTKVCDSTANPEVILWASSIPDGSAQTCSGLSVWSTVVLRDVTRCQTFAPPPSAKGHVPWNRPTGFCLADWHRQLQLLLTVLWLPHLWLKPPHTPPQRDDTYQAPPLSLCLSSIIFARWLKSVQWVAGCCRCLRLQRGQHELWVHMLSLSLHWFAVYKEFW